MYLAAYIYHAETAGAEGEVSRVAGLNPIYILSTLTDGMDSYLELADEKGEVAGPRGGRQCA